MSSLDLTARRTVMSAVLYYGMDTPMLPDREFDEGCKLVIANWKDLAPIHKWALGSPEELATTGYHIKATMAAVSGAMAWADLRCIPTEAWRHSKKFNTRWLPCGSFAPA